MIHIKIIHIFIAIISMVIAGTTTVVLIQTDTSDDNQIEFVGTIDAINGTIIVVDGQQVDISNADISGNLVVGIVVSITGEVDDDGDDDDDDSDIVIATTIVIITTLPDQTAEITPEVTAEATMEATPEMTPESTLEVTPEITPDVIVCNDDDDDCDEDVIIVIEGPVQAININIITIFDIDIMVDINDPILTTIQVGDPIRVEGISSIQNNVIIIIAINITIIQIEIIQPEPGAPPPPANNQGSGRGSGSNRSS